jgi:hypothetical protein
LLKKLKATGDKKKVKSVRDLKKRLGADTLPGPEITNEPGPETTKQPGPGPSGVGGGDLGGGDLGGGDFGGGDFGGGDFGAAGATGGGSGFDFEGQAEELLSGFDQKFLDDLGFGQETFQEDRATAAENFDTDIQRFLDEFRSDQDRRQQDYLNLLTDQAAKASEFDPEKFRTTLLELESSRRRQKDWNERSARQAYKY